MIRYANKMYGMNEILEKLDEDVENWFLSRFNNFTPPQRLSVPLIDQGINLLISSPTGTGKTLTAFLSIINYLYSLAKKGKLENRTYCIYISPLKALGRDIEKNLMRPLEEIYAIAEENSGGDYEDWALKGGAKSSGKDKADNGSKIPKIRLAVRTGDTSSKEKQKMTRQAPHILITTPETLSIVLSTSKFIKKLTKTRYVIIDEIHDLASSKRGSLLSLSMERLQNLVGQDLVRIGLSATQSPIEDIGRYLVGRENGRSRDITIVQYQGEKKYDIKVLPAFDSINQPYDQRFDGAIRIIKGLVEHHGNTIIFTNTRRMSEKITLKLKEIGFEDVATHHGSMGKKLRFEIEDKLKTGEIKAVSTSSSLELGIDVGHIDLVIQLGTPKSVSRAIQRVGRAGHTLGEVARGRFVALEMNDLVECCTIALNISRSKLDDIVIPRNCEDVLAQAIVGISLEDKIKEHELHELIRQTDIYKDIKMDELRNVLRFLSDENLSRYHLYPRVDYNTETGDIEARGSTRLIYFLNAGTIPPQMEYRVRSSEDDSYVGKLSGSFVERLSKNDVFLLGGRSYRFVKAIGTSVYVKNAGGMAPTIPSWTGGVITRNPVLSVDVGRFFSTLEASLMETGITKDEGEMYGQTDTGELKLKEPSKRFGKQIIDLLSRRYKIDEKGAGLLLDYILEQSRSGTIVPSERKILVEGYIDNLRMRNIVLHSVFGWEINEVIARVLSSMITSRYGGKVKYTIHDNGIVLTLEEVEGFRLDHIFNLVHHQNVKRILRDELKDSELFKRRFLHCANRSLAILKNYKGHKISTKKQQHQILDMLRDIPPDIMKSLPPYRETYNEIMNQFLDIEKTEEVLRRIAKGQIKVYVKDYTTRPSVFAYSLIVPTLSEVSALSSQSMVFKQLGGRLFEEIIGHSRVLGLEGEGANFTKELVDGHFKRDATYYKKLNSFALEEKRIFTEAEERIRLGKIKDHTTPMSRVDVVKDGIRRFLSEFGPFTQRELEAHFDFCLSSINLTSVLAELELEADLVKAPIMKTEERQYYILRKDLRSLSLDNQGKHVFSGDVLQDMICEKFFSKKKEFFAALEEGLVMGSALDIYQTTRRFSKNKWQSAVKDGKLVRVRFKRSRPRYLPVESASRFIWVGRTASINAVEQYVLKRIIENPGVKRYELYKTLEMSKGQIYEALYHLERNLWLGRSKALSANKYTAIGFVPIPNETFDNIFFTEDIEGLAEDEHEAIQTMENNGVSGSYSSNMKKELMTPEIKEKVLDSLKGLINFMIDLYGPISTSTLQEHIDLPKEQMDAIIDSLLTSDAVRRVFIENPYPTQMLVSSEDFNKMVELDDSCRRRGAVSQIISRTHPYFHLIRHKAFLKFTGVWTHIVIHEGEPICSLRIEEDKDDVRALNLEIPSQGQAKRFMGMGNNEMFLPEETDNNKRIISKTVECMEELLNFYREFDIDIINIEKINGVLVDKLLKDEHWLIDSLTNSGAALIDDRLIVGNLIGQSYPSKTILEYMFYKQHLHPDTIITDPTIYMDHLKMVGSTSELQLRCKCEGKDIRAFANINDLVKAKLVPPRLMYTTRDLIRVYKTAKTERISPTAKYLLEVMPTGFLRNAKKWKERSTLSNQVFREKKKELLDSLHVVKDPKNTFVLVGDDLKMSKKRARKECIKYLFSTFGVFSLGNLKRYIKDTYSIEELRTIINSFVAEGYLVKGYLRENSSEIYYMVKEDVPLLEDMAMFHKFILPPKDPVWYYLKEDIRDEFGRGDWHIVFKGGDMVAGFKGIIESDKFIIEEYKGKDIYKFVVEKWVWKQGLDVKGLKV